jgi:DNA modification methylase
MAMPGPNTAYPADTTAILVKLLHEYRASGNALAVSFRDLVPWIKVGERATHYLHSYPAKLLPQIAHFFLAARGWLAVNETILDPFAGTGTVALEANLSGRQALYADVNPLARLITSAKTTAINIEAASDLLLEIKARVDQIVEAQAPWVVNVDLWYCTEVKQDLARLRCAIAECHLGEAADFVWATFSATARKCSRADGRFAVPVRAKATTEDRNHSIRTVWSIFSDQYTTNLNRQIDLQRLSGCALSTKCVGMDARSLVRPNDVPTDQSTALPKDSVGFVLTSPPYAGAQKYVRASSLSLGWLGMTEPGTLKKLENMSIGREHFVKSEMAEIPETGIGTADEIIRAITKVNRVRAAICAYYLREMDEAIGEVARVLKPNGKAVVVIGDNTVCGMPFTSSLFLTELFEHRGMRLTLKLVDSIKSRGLLTKRSGGAIAIQSETILVFVK